MVPSMRSGTLHSSEAFFSLRKKMFGLKIHNQAACFLITLCNLDSNGYLQLAHNLRPPEVVFTY